MGHGLERVDVEAAVGFVEYCVFRFEYGELQNLSAFFLTAGKTFVDCARRKRAIHSKQLHFFVKARVILGRLEFFTFGQTRLERGAKEISNGHTRNLAWILKREKQTFARTIVGLERE